MRTKKDKEILRYLYKHCNDGNFYDVSIIFNPSEKQLIDKCVVELEHNNYVHKRVKGYLPISALGSDDDKSFANNSICKITSKGIEYYENFQNRKRSYFFSILSLIISILTLAFSLIYNFLRT